MGTISVACVSSGQASQRLHHHELPPPTAQSFRKLPPTRPVGWGGVLTPNSTEEFGALGDECPGTGRRRFSVLLAQLGAGMGLCSQHCRSASLARRRGRWTGTTYPESFCQGSGPIILQTVSASHEDLQGQWLALATGFPVTLCQSCSQNLWGKGRGAGHGQGLSSLRNGHCECPIHPNVTDDIICLSVCRLACGAQPQERPRPEGNEVKQP